MRLKAMSEESVKIYRSRQFEIGMKYARCSPIQCWGFNAEGVG